MKRVLVADTDPDFSEKVSIWLGNEFKISDAKTSAGALRKAREERPDLILLGCLEPRGESFNLNRELREQGGSASIPILVVDVQPKKHLRKGWRRHEGLQMDAEGYLCRPLDSQTLKSEVTRILDSTSAGMLVWTQILEQTEKTLLQEVQRWNGTGQRLQQIRLEYPQKHRREQTAALRL